MGSETVLLVESGESAAAAAAAFEALDCSVETLADTDTLVRELCLSTVHCLVLPAELPSTTGPNVAAGVRGLYPDLPIIVAGSTVEACDATGLPEASVTDEAVVEAVDRALERDVTPAAARTPTRLETLALSLFETFPEHLFAKDERARHLLTSPELFDYGDVVGRRDVDLDPPDEHREAAYADDLSVIESGEPIRDLDEYARQGDRYVETTKLPWTDADGSVIGLVGVARDVTERKRSERAFRDQSQRLAKVALYASHRLRNELQVAQGRVEQARSDPETIDDVARSLSRIDGIVDEVVKLTTQWSHETDPQTQWLSSVAREVWDDLATDAATLEVDADTRIHADLESVRFLLDILFENAVQHGGPAVTVSVGVVENGFYVADDGEGFATDDHDEVLAAGYASDSSGSGLGLFIARRVAETNGWELSATSSVDDGARFDVTGVPRPDPPHRNG